MSARSLHGSHEFVAEPDNTVAAATDLPSEATSLPRELSFTPVRTESDAAALRTASRDVSFDESGKSEEVGVSRVAPSSLVTTTCRVLTTPYAAQGLPVQDLDDIAASRSTRSGTGSSFAYTAAGSRVSGPFHGNLSNSAQAGHSVVFSMPTNAPAGTVKMITRPSSLFHLKVDANWGAPGIGSSSASASFGHLQAIAVNGTWQINEWISNTGISVDKGTEDRGTYEFNRSRAAYTASTTVVPGGSYQFDASTVATAVASTSADLIAAGASAGVDAGGAGMDFPGLSDDGHARVDEALGSFILEFQIAGYAVNC